MMARAMAISGLAALGLGGCSADRSGPEAGVEVSGLQVVQTLRIDANLVDFLVQTDRRDEAELLDDYAQCAAAGYTLRQGYGFSRHIRTNRSNTGGIWQADAVYSITPTLPRGSRTLDADVIAQNCAERGIPTS